MLNIHIFQEFLISFVIVSFQKMSHDIHTIELHLTKSVMKKLKKGVVRNKIKHRWSIYQWQFVVDAYYSK
jgi:RNase P protein component